MKTKENFFKAHYDWIIAAVGVAAIAASVVLFLPALSNSPEAAVQQREAWLSSVKPAHNEVEPVPLGVLNGAQRLAKSPPVLNAIDPKLGSFLASEKRAFCKPGDPALKGCGKPIPVGAETCPFCAIAQKIEQKASADADNDGLPNDWETKYGLNPNDGSDADKDADNDGFTNAEEFAAKTDPTDKNDHPDYLDSLKIVLPLRETYMPFVFTRATKIPTGWRCEFFDASQKDDYGRLGRTLTATIDEEIGAGVKKPTGFVLKSYERKEAKRARKGMKGMTVTVDVSEATVERKRDGKVIKLVVADKKSKPAPVDVQATLSYERGTVKNFEVVPGSEIDLNGSKYRILAIEHAGKGAKVTVENSASGKKRVLEALEQ